MILMTMDSDDIRPQGQQVEWHLRVARQWRTAEYFCGLGFFDVGQIFGKKLRRGIFDAVFPDEDTFPLLRVHFQVFPYGQEEIHGIFRYIRREGVSIGQPLFPIGENEYFLLEQSVKHTFLCRELYPERLSFLNPECNYGCILKKLHIGDPNQDKIGVWIVVNSGSFCPNEMLKYLSLRSEMCMPHTPGTEEIAIRSFANFRYKFYSNFDTELLRQFIKSRNLSPQADIKILDLICRHIQDQALLEEYGRLSLMCGIDTLSKTLDVFKRHGDKWPESQIAFYAAIIKQYPQDEICDMAYTYIHFTIKSISLHQKELLSEKGSILKLLKTLSDCASNGKYRSLGSKIVSEIIHIPELISAEILSILLLQWKDELQTELNRYTNTSHLSKILDMLIELKTPNTDAKQFVELKQSAISHVVKNILVLDSRLNDKLAEILYQFKLTNLKSLPSSIKKSISDIEREELDFQSFMQAFAWKQTP